VTPTYCGNAASALGKLRAIGEAKSASLNDSDRQRLDDTVGELQKLAAMAPIEVSEPAQQVGFQLKTLESLALADPRGADEATRSKAQELTRGYAVSVENLRTAISLRCNVVGMVK